MVKQTAIKENERSLYQQRVDIFQLEMEELTKRVENNINSYLFSINGSDYIEMEKFIAWYSPDFDDTIVRFIPKDTKLRRCDDTYKERYRGMIHPFINDCKKKNNMVESVKDIYDKGTLEKDLDRLFAAIIGCNDEETTISMDCTKILASATTLQNQFNDLKEKVREIKNKRLKMENNLEEDNIWNIPVAKIRNRLINSK